MLAPGRGVISKETIPMRDAHLTIIRCCSFATKNSTPNKTFVFIPPPFLCLKKKTRTKLQLQRTSYVRAGKNTKIFITNAHGDHSFGLPGVLCLLKIDLEIHLLSRFMDPKGYEYSFALPYVTAFPVLFPIILFTSHGIGMETHFWGY